MPRSRDRIQLAASALGNASSKWELTPPTLAVCHGHWRPWQPSPSLPWILMGGINEKKQTTAFSKGEKNA
nr:hypothetical protein [Mariniblastus sp.]